MRFLASLLLFLLPGTLWAACSGSDLRDLMTAEQRSQITQRIDAQPYARGNHWIARRGTRTLHVIGTLHLNDPRMEEITTKLAPVIEAADLLLLEAAPADKSAFERELSLTPELTLITDGPSLIDRLTPTQWEALADKLRAQGIPPWMGAKMRPWFLGMSLAIPRCVMQQKDYKNGLDMRLAAVAEDAGVAMQSLEDPMEVIRLMDADPLDEQVRQLQAYTALMGGGEDLMTTTVEAYFDQDPLSSLYLSEQAFLADPHADPDAAAALWDKSMNALLAQRNRAWIPVIEAAAGDTIVVAAGALHLPGEMGVLNLLAQQGYQISPGTWP